MKRMPFTSPHPAVYEGYRVEISSFKCFAMRALICHEINETTLKRAMKK